MSNHRTSGLADPTDADDAITRRYVALRFQALSDEVQDEMSKLDVLQNLLGVENNRVLIRKYELDADFEKLATTHHITAGEWRIEPLAWLRKHPHVPDDTNEFGFIDILLLKNILYLFSKNHLLATIHG